MQLRRKSKRSLKELTKEKDPKKGLEKPSRTTVKKRLEKPSGKIPEKSLKNALKKKPRKSSSKASCMGSKMPSNKSRKTSEKSKKVSHHATSSEGSQKIPKEMNNTKAVVRRQSALCNVCKRTFTSKKLLNAHSTKHHYLRHCPNCPKTFRHTRKFIFHLRSHLEDHPYECKICLESFNRKNDFVNHKGVHKDCSRLSCETCSETFPHLASLNRHRLAHNGPPYPCDECSAVFSNVPDRTVHSKNHVRRCFLCCNEVVTFSSDVYLAAHMYLVHRNEKCDSNEAVVQRYVSTGAVTLGEDNDSDSMDDLLSSSDEESNGDADSDYQKDAVEPVHSLKRKDKFMCFICYDLYPSCELLKSHMKAHNWYPCNSCPQFFANSEALEKHKCGLTEVPSFLCEICNCETECQNCKEKFETMDNVSEVNKNALESTPPRYPEMTLGLTDYSDVAQQNRLIDFIKCIKSQTGPLDLGSFHRVGFHCLNLKIILEIPAVNSLFPRECITNLEQLYSEFQNLSQILLNRLNRSSTR